MRYNIHIAIHSSGKFTISDKLEMGYVNKYHTTSMSVENRLEFDTIKEAQQYVKDELGEESELSPLIKGMIERGEL